MYSEAVHFAYSREYSYTDMNQVSIIKDYTDFLNDTGKYMTRTYEYDDIGRSESIEYEYEE